MFSEYSEVIGAVTLTDIVTSQESFELPSLTSYPNPTQEFISLDWQSPGAMAEQLEIMNAIGKKMFSKTLNQTRTAIQIDVSRFPKGIYYLRFRKGNAVLTQKVIKF